MSGETATEVVSGPGTEGEVKVDVTVPEVNLTDGTKPFDILVDQGLTGISEAELRGEDVNEDGSLKAVETVVPKVEEPGKADEGVKPVEPNAETETLPPKVDTPPKGFVPTAAVREVREENRQLKERLRVLEAKVLEPPPVKTAQPIPEVRADFKVLTGPEFKELSEESPRDALVYMAELRDYEKAESIKADATRAQAQREVEVNNLFNESVKLMEEAVPDLFTEGSTAQQELAEFAETVGFTKDMFYLTNPETQVILPGESEPVYLGTQAASFVKMLADLRAKPGSKGAVDEAALRKTIEADLRKTLEAEILNKIKTGKGTSFRSIGDIPSSDSEVPGSKAPLTEAQYARLTPAQQKAYLSGE